MKLGVAYMYMRFYDVYIFFVLCNVQVQQNNNKVFYYIKYFWNKLIVMHY